MRKLLIVAAILLSILLGAQMGRAGGQTIPPAVYLPLVEKPYAAPAFYTGTAVSLILTPTDMIGFWFVNNDSVWQLSPYDHDESEYVSMTLMIGSDVSVLPTVQDAMDLYSATVESYTLPRGVVETLPIGEQTDLFVYGNMRHLFFRVANVVVHIYSRNYPDLVREAKIVRNRIR